jgi:hypothetical protein
MRLVLPEAVGPNRKWDVLSITPGNGEFSNA